MKATTKSGASEAKYLTAKQAAEFIGVRISYLYKLTCAKKIPFYNPSGRKLLFNISELDAWVKSARVSTNEEIERRIHNELMKEG